MINYDDYLYLVFEVDNQDIKYILSYDLYGRHTDALSSLSIRMRFTDLVEKYNYNNIYDIPLEEGENVIHNQNDSILTELGKQNLDNVIKEATKPTLYTDGRNLFTLNFDNNFNWYDYENIDLFYFIDPKLSRIKGRILKFYLPRILPQ